MNLQMLKEQVLVANLDLPRHGLQVIPYEGGAVFTQDGDYLASTATTTRIGASSRAGRRATPRPMTAMRAT